MGNDSVRGQRPDCVDFGKARERERQRQVLEVPAAGVQGYRGAEVFREVPRTSGLPSSHCGSGIKEVTVIQCARF
ncbi:hypothetical protein ACRRTK_001517 [Alexandromys fortis]